ncbi:MAG: hypothetical protein U9Q82_09305, partial [Chloroflexota bacterium]|nr:hypothetical protein [Chloroflexota bacterium]
MTLRYYTFLFILGLSGALLLSAFQPAPGYMDSEYYFATAMRIAGGKGFSEPFLWNYLDDPQNIPHPSHAYWMPLTSLLAAAGMRVFGTFTYLAAQSGFLLLAGLISPLTALLSYRLNRDRFLAILSGLLAVFSVFYLPFLVVTDTFAIYMLLGVLFFLLLSPSPTLPRTPAPGLKHHRFFLPLLLGLIAGLMHLSRADGVL